MKTNKYFSMTALAIVIVGAIITSCSSDNNNNEIVTPPQPVNTDKVETLTVSVSMGNGAAGTRALTSEGVKTFAEGETMALIYTNMSDETVKVVSDPLEEGDISGTGDKLNKIAQFTFTLENPKKSLPVTYIYPAAMAKDDGSVNYDALSEQNGTLATLASSLDYCEYTGKWSGENLPSGDLGNKFAICAFTLKDALGKSEITSSITSLVLTEGSNIYTVSRSAGAGPIYVAIRPTSEKTINFLAGAGTTTYAKYVQNKTYEAGKMYKIGLKMAEVIKGKFSVSSTEQVYFSKGNLRAECASADNNGSTQETWTWKFSANQWDRIGGLKSADSGTKSGNNNIDGNGSISVAGNVDLFGWSTSATYLGINVTNSNNTAYLGAFVDWGSHADVIAGIGTDWRTLTSDEWRYLTVTRSGNRFALARLHTSGSSSYRAGFILLPDDWKTSYYALSSINDASVSFSTNTITYTDWTSKLEKNGAVFLPVTGQRNGGNWINGADDQLHYWSSTKGDTDGGTGANANHMRWMPNTTTPEANRGLAPDTGAGRCNGYAVRLVYDIK